MRAGSGTMTRRERTGAVRRLATMLSTPITILLIAPVVVLASYGRDGTLDVRGRSWQPIFS
jgi:hypothetical protein